MAGLFIGLAAFTASPTSVSADVESIDMPEGLSHGVETCSGIPGAGPCEVIRVKAQEDHGDLFIKVDRGTLSRVIEASVSTPFGPQDCPFNGEGTSSIAIHTDACDSNSVTSDNLVVLLSLIPNCPGARTSRLVLKSSASLGPSWTTSPAADHRIVAS
jgi:hypothetical protein